MSQEQGLGASARADRATRASPEPASGLGQKASVPCAFTPGPWTLTQHAKFGDTQMYWVNENTSVGTQVEPDVHLIVAAPELYAALEFYASEWREPSPEAKRLGHAGPAMVMTHRLVCDYGERAKAALAKARGRGQ